MAILVFDTNGKYVVKPTLEAARINTDVAGKVVVVTSALTQAQSNISGPWPADRMLEFRKGGSIVNSTAFTINGPFTGADGCFKGAGVITFGTGSASAVRPEWFGDTPLNNTSTVQKALTAAAASKIWVDGSNRTYIVSTVSMVSGQRVRDMGLDSVGPLTGGAVSMQPVVFIDGRTVLKTDMIFRNVRVNGHRELFTNIDATGGGAGEDGGMHGWRVIGEAAGGVTNILWEDCEGTNCGTAGLAIHSANGNVTVADYPIKNLKWIGGKLSGNREHGWWADSFDGLAVMDADCTANGQDLNTIDAMTHGNRGARILLGGNLYFFGSGFDLESYVGVSGTLYKNLYLRNLDCRNNSMASQMYSPVPTDQVGFVAPSNLHVIDCKFDKGTAAGAERYQIYPGIDYSFLVYANMVAPAYAYQNIIMSGNIFEEVAPIFNGVEGLTVTGGYIAASAIKARVYNCLYWDVSANSSSVELEIFPVISPPTFTRTQGAGGAAVLPYVVRTISKPGGELRVHIEGSITGGLASGGDLVYTFSSPLTGSVITEMDISTRAPEGVSVASTASLDVGGQATIVIDTSGDATIYFKIVLSLSPGL